MSISRKIRNLRKVKYLFQNRFLYPNISPLKKGDVAFISGAYILDTLTRASRVVGPSGYIYAVEANPKAYNAIKDECAKIKNLTYINCAVWSSPGTMNFISTTDDYHSYDKLVDPTIPFDFPHELKDSHVIEVPTNSIDNILSEHGCDRLDYLELMVNGAEIEALRGAEKTIKASTPGLTVRTNCVHPKPLDELLTFMNEEDFEYVMTFTDKAELSNKSLSLARILATKR